MKYEIKYKLVILLVRVDVNRDVKLEYKFLKEKVKEYNKKDAQFYSNIFAKMNKMEQSKSAVSWNCLCLKCSFIF